MNKINCDETEVLINEFIDGEITSTEKVLMDEHIAVCDECREALEETTLLVKKAGTCKCDISPRKDIWNDINERISKDNYSLKDAFVKKSSANYRYYAYAIAAVFIMAAVILLFTRIGLKEPNPNSPVYLQIGTFWQVSSINGSPKIEHEDKNQSAVQKIDSFKIGEYIITDGESKAEITISDIGKVTVEPNSKVKFVNSAAGNNRIQLDYGTINADITAKPGEFYVDAASATVIDLGCEYTFSVDSAGDGVIYVKEGMVKLEAPNREAMVPAGKMCMTKKDIGPGTPYAAGTSSELQKALINFDFNNCSSECVRTIVSKSGKNDVYTLISMAPRVDEEDRMMLYKRISNYAVPPRAVPDDTIKFNRQYWKEWSETFGKEMQEQLKENLDDLDEKIMVQIEKSMQHLNEAMENMKFEFQEMEIPDEDGHKKHQYRFYRKFRGDDGKYHEYNDTIIQWDKQQFKEDMKKFKEEMKNYKFEFQDMQKELDEDLKDMNKDLEESLKELDSLHIEINVENNKFNEELQKEIQIEVQKEMDKVKIEMEKVKEEMERNREAKELNEEKENEKKEESQDNNLPEEQQ